MITEKIVVLKEDVESVLHTLIQNDLGIIREDYSITVNSLCAVVSFDKTTAKSYAILQERNKLRNNEVCNYSSFEDHLKLLTNNNVKPAFCYYENGIIIKIFFSLNYQIKLTI